jgi:hypothetical protein
MTITKCGVEVGYAISGKQPYPWKVEPKQPLVDCLLTAIAQFNQSGVLGLGFKPGTLGWWRS